MCWAMATTGLENQQDETEERLRRHLAAIVRSIQWSYAVIWSASTGQQGTLEWSCGYYNGDIKTRKTTQPLELNGDRWGLQRSEQLRELYVSLSDGDSNQQARRPSASLSPEDLTDSEWYYLVCMSFTFCHGQGLPGRTLSSGNHIWLNNAHFADSKVFSRSLLAKSANIQTVACFPFMSGVLELGTAEALSDDPNLAKQLTTSFWEFPISVYSEQSISSSLNEEEDDDDQLDPGFDEDVNASILEPLNPCLDSHTQSERGQTACPLARTCSDELKTGSADDSSNDCCPFQHTDDSFMVENMNGLSQVESLQFVDDDIGNGPHASLKSSDCVSLSFVNPQRVISSPKGGRIDNCFQDLQYCDKSKLTSLDALSDDLHYRKTLSAILRTPCQVHAEPLSPYGSRASCFTVWKKCSNSPKIYTGTPQKMLKKILFGAAWMASNPLVDLENNGSDNKSWKSEEDVFGLTHILSERRRREKLNEKFVVLRSLIPTISKVDKASVLADTIEYLKNLEKRVEELESCKELTDCEARGRRKHPDISERTSDNYGNNALANGRRPSLNKRKACDIDETESEHHWILSKDGLTDISVTIVDREVFIEMHCPWRECLLLEVVDAVSSLHLDAHSVQSSTLEGTLSLTVKSKFRGTVLASPGMIKQALYRVVGKC